MFKTVLAVLACIFLSVNVFAQESLNNPAGSAHYKYYIRILGVNTRADVERLENSVSVKPGIRSFIANRYPVRYFLMEAERKITRTEFRRWLDPRYSVDMFGEGGKSRESAIARYNKILKAK